MQPRSLVSALFVAAFTLGACGQAELVQTGRTVVSTHEDRPNHWGTHAGGARIAVALYLHDAEDLERAGTVFRGWLGDRDAYAGFKYRALD